MPEPIRVFISYAHEDTLLRLELDKHLSILQQQGLIQGWHDNNISAGTEWEHEINSHLDTAQIILLLVSANFLSSQYCSSIELKRALQKHREGSARLIPILLRPVDWQGTPFSHLQVLPAMSKPVSSWKGLDGRDRAFSSIIRDIRLVVEELRSQPRREPLPYEPAKSTLQQTEALPPDPPSLYSQEGSISIHITFLNRSQDDIAIYWLNYRGDEVLYFRLTPGESRIQQTYVSHPWRVKDNNGKLLREIVATEDAQTYIIPAFLCSMEGTVAISVTFRNKSQDTVAIYWVDYQGKEKLYHWLEAGHSRSQRTYISHPWRVKDVDGKVLSEIVAARDSQVLYIR